MLRPNIQSKDKYPDRLEINFVDVEEDEFTNPGDKTKVHWRLLTNHEVNTVEEAKKIIGYYLLRWTIEPIFANIKKKGLDVEAMMLESFEKTKKLITIALESAIKVFHLLTCRSGKSDTEAALIFSPSELAFLSIVIKKLEGKTEKQRNPFLPYKMSWASWIIARLGGWKGYKSERPPGHLTLSEGLKKFHYMFEGWGLVNA